MMELATPKTNFVSLEKVVSAGVDSSLLQPPPFGNGVLDVTGFLHLVALILVTVMCEGYSVRGRVHRGQHAHLFLILVAVLCEVQRRGTLPSALFRMSAVISVFFPEARVCDRSGVAIVHRTWDFFFGKLAFRNNSCTKTVPHLYTLVFRARQSYVYIELFASVSRLENLPCHPSAYGDVDLQERVRWIWPGSASAFASRIAESVLVDLASFRHLVRAWLPVCSMSRLRAMRGG